MAKSVPMMRSAVRAADRFLNSPVPVVFVGRTAHFSAAAQREIFWRCEQAVSLRAMAARYLRRFA